MRFEHSFVENSAPETTLTAYPFPFLTESILKLLNQPEFQALYIAAPQKKRRLYLEINQNQLDTLNMHAHQRQLHMMILSNRSEQNFVCPMVLTGETCHLIWLLQQLPFPLQYVKMDLSEFSWLSPPELTLTGQD